MRREGQSYQNIREYLDTVPVIDTHEHYAGISEPIDNVFELFASYSMADFSSAAFGADEQPRRLLRDPDGSVFPFAAGSPLLNSIRSPSGTFSSISD